MSNVMLCTNCERHYAGPPNTACPDCGPLVPDVAVAADTRIADLERQLAEVKAMLLRVEWSSYKCRPTGGPGCLKTCPVCDGVRPAHENGCELAAGLAAVTVAQTVGGPFDRSPRYPCE